MEASKEHDKEAQRFGTQMHSEVATAIDRFNRISSLKSMVRRVKRKAIATIGVGLMLITPLYLGAQNNKFNFTDTTISSITAPVKPSKKEVANPNWHIQMGMSFGKFNEKVTSLAVDIVAHEEEKVDEHGKVFGNAYILNALTQDRKGGYHWYQLGFSPNWMVVSVKKGDKDFTLNGDSESAKKFQIIYQIFDATDGSGILRSSESRADIPAKEGDIIRLKIYIEPIPNNNAIVMEAINLNNNKVRRTQEDALGASEFIGTPNKPQINGGLFTGVMTESFHLSEKSSLYNGKDMTYKFVETPDAPVWIWISEFRTDRNRVLNTIINQVIFQPVNNSYKMNFENLSVAYVKGSEGQELTTASSK